MLNYPTFNLNFIYFTYYIDGTIQSKFPLTGQQLSLSSFDRTIKYYLYLLLTGQ